MSKLKQQLLKLELSKIGFTEAEYSPDTDMIMVQSGNTNILRIDDKGTAFFASGYSHHALSKIGSITSKINEIMGAWENSQPMPFDDVSQFKALISNNTTVLAARDDSEYGHGLHFVTWKYDADGTGVHHGNYTTDYTSAKESFALRSGLVQEEKIITKEQAADIKAAIEAYRQQPIDYTLDNRLAEINAQLCHTYPEIFNTEEQCQKPAFESRHAQNRNKPSLRDKLNTANEIAQSADIKKPGNVLKTTDRE